MNIIEIIFSKYWSQTTLVLAVVGYFIKRSYDLKTKKIETNFSLIQQNRINAFSSFLAEYTRTRRMWLMLPYFEIFQHKITPKEIDEIIWKPLNDFHKSTLLLKLYFNEEECIQFDKMYERFNNINQTLSELHFSQISNTADTKRTNAFAVTRDIEIEKNDMVLEEICRNFRGKFT